MTSALLTPSCAQKTLITAIVVSCWIPLWAVASELQDWRFKPIPAESTNLTTASYHALPVDRTDPRFKEPLVELKDYGVSGVSHYARTDKFNAPYYMSIPGTSARLYARATIARNLQKVNEDLKPLGLEVFVFDAYRSVECQKALWGYFLEEARKKLPAGTTSDWVAYAERYCSNPTLYKVDDSRTWPTHNTGGAVDLTLRQRVTGQLLYMGSIFDDDSTISSTAYFESNPARTASEKDAQRNRRLLYWVMRKHGFANYPQEWWHFDYGTQMWALNGGASGASAFYGPAQFLEPEQTRGAKSIAPLVR